MKTIKLTKIDCTLEDDMIPSYSTPGSAGMDLRAMSSDNFTLNPGQTSMFGTGFAIHIEDPSLCAMIFPRSGLSSKHGIKLANTVGIIDSDYQGEIKVCLENTSQIPYQISYQERIAQIVFVPVVQVGGFEIVKSFEESERGTGGFGSTGK